MKSTESCTLAEFAQLRGFTDSYARRLRRAGRLVIGERMRVLIEPSIARIAATAHRAGPNGVDVAGYRDVSRESEPTLADGLHVALELVAGAHAEIASIRDCRGADFDTDPRMVKACALLEAGCRRLRGMLAQAPANGAGTAAEASLCR